MDQAPQQAKKIETYLVLFIFLAIITLVLGIYLYSLIFDKKINLISSFYFLDSNSTKPEQIVGKPPAPVITDIDFSQGGNDSKSMGKSLKGFFQEYNSKDKTLTFKNQFLGSSYLQLLKVNLNQITEFSCWPKEYENNGKTIQTQSLEFFVEPDGRDIVLPVPYDKRIKLEKIVPFDQLETFLTPDIYVIIQLKEIFNIEEQNNVQKLVLLGC